MTEITLGPPRDYGVEHDAWRPNQHDALKRIFAYTEEAAISEENPGHVYLQLGTGSGKTALSTALGHNDRVLALVHSLGLLDQYEQKYGFSIVKGMAQYDCVNEDVIMRFRERTKRVPTVADCPFDKKTECPVAQYCPYLIARDNALSARRTAVTYPYALLSYPIQERRGTVVLDECHIAPEAIVNMCSIMFTEKMRDEWSLPAFPLYGTRAGLTDETTGKVRDWLRASMIAMGTQPPMQFPDERARWNAAYAKLKDTQLELEINQDYFLESYYEDRYFRGRKKRYNYLSLRPFTAGKFSGKLFANKKLVVMMSATIGDPKPLAEELAIDDYEFFDYPHPIPSDRRPVYNLGMERMTYGNLSKSPALYTIQARKIANFIESLPGDWRGIVLTSSYDKLEKLRGNLSKLLNGRVFIPPKAGPAERIEAFLTDKRKGLVSVDLIQSWGTGIDLWADAGRFSVIAGLPFKNTQTDPFERERVHRYGAAYSWWQAYMAVPQAAGRVSRGEREESGEFMLNVAALADGSAMSPKALGSYPSYFRDAIMDF